jgi:hypothetical protein
MTSCRDTFVTALLTIGCDYLTGKKRKISRFFCLEKIKAFQTERQGWVIPACPFRGKGQ